MASSLCAPDQPSPEALPLAEEPPLLPVIDTQDDYPSGVQRVSRTADRPVVRQVRAATAPAAARKKKRELPPDWPAKKRMLFLCFLLLIANICVGAYLVLTSKKREPPRPEPPKRPLPEGPSRQVVPPPSRPIDVGSTNYRIRVIVESRGKDDARRAVATFLEGQSAPHRRA